MDLEIQMKERKRDSLQILKQNHQLKKTFSTPATKKTNLKTKDPQLANPNLNPPLAMPKAKTKKAKTSMTRLKRRWSKSNS